MAMPIAAPFLAHRRRGQGFANLLVALVLLMVVGFFAWNQFVKNRSLIMAGKQVTEMKEYNQGGDLEYRRQFREKHRGTAQTTRAHMSRLVGATVAGKYDGQKANFEQKYHEVLGDLLESIGRLDMNEVPRQFLAPHIELSTSHRYFYESLESLWTGYFQEGPDRVQHYDQARKSLKSGLAASTRGEEGISRQLGDWNQR